MYYPIQYRHILSSTDHSTYTNGHWYLNFKSLNTCISSYPIQCLYLLFLTVEIYFNIHDYFGKKDGNQCFFWGFFNIGSHIYTQKNNQTCSDKIVNRISINITKQTCLGMNEHTDTYWYLDSCSAGSSHRVTYKLSTQKLIYDYKVIKPFTSPEK